jgi:hypothetical protein
MEKGKQSDAHDSRSGSRISVADWRHLFLV